MKFIYVICNKFSTFLTINKTYLDFKLLSWNEYWFFVLGFMHGMRGEFSDDVSGASCGSHLHWSWVTAWPVKMGLRAAPETSSKNLLRTACKNPETKINIHLDFKPKLLLLFKENLICFGKKHRTQSKQRKKFWF